MKQKKLLFFTCVIVIFCLTVWMSINFLTQPFRKNLNLAFFDQQNISKEQEKSFDSNVARRPADLTAVGPSGIPIGTQMMIPPWVLQQYHQSPQKAMYGDVLNFLIYNYSLAAPSPNNEYTDDIYIPLTRYNSEDYYRNYDDDSDEYSDYDEDDDDEDYSDRRRRNDTVMVPVTHLKINSEEPSAKEQSPAQSPEQTPPKSETPPPAESDTKPKEQPTPPAKAKSAKSKPVQSQPANNGPIMHTTENVDPKKSPSSPELKPEDNLMEQQREQSPATCEKPNTQDSQTEAGAPCVDCSVGIGLRHIHQDLNVTKLQEFLSDANETVATFQKQKKFSSVIDTMCKECHPIDVNDLIQYIEDRSKSVNVPPEIMFALMMRESTGRCNAERSEENGKSFGLFQLYTANSTKLRSCTADELKDKTTEEQKEACQDGQYRTDQKYKEVKYTTSAHQRPNIKPGVCLNNPYCNFEEALHLLKGQKWAVYNKKDKKVIEKPTGKWPEMSAKERNQWRNAIISYNGNKYHDPAYKAYRKFIKASSKSLSPQQSKVLNIDNWEIKRLFFIRDYLEASDNKKKINLLHNLAYVERIAGRERPGGLANSSICQWINFRKNNQNLSCPEQKGQEKTNLIHAKPAKQVSGN